MALECTGKKENNPWQGGIPFVVPLRNLTPPDAGKPKIEEFVHDTLPKNLFPQIPPKDWTLKILKSKRAVVLLDGVDELPHKFRDNFWSWLDEFIEFYPGNRILVTSRYLPTTAPEDWNPPTSFVDAALNEMTDEDIRQFIHNWHDAALHAKIDNERRRELEKARNELPQKLFDASNRRVRELCSIPLLCSMVCALHWHEEGYLPKRRIDLYERCVSMLIEERDKKRGIEKPEPPLNLLSKNDKEMLLQRLALQMMVNNIKAFDGSYRIEITRKQAVDWLALWIPSIKDENARKADTEKVLDYLIERTGLIREPAPGMIDFPHRSFQEYFAACAAGANGDCGFLANIAHDDQWRETIILAAGTKKGGVPFGRNLIEALLERGEQETKGSVKDKVQRQTCFALALACLDTIEEIDEPLRERVLSHMKTLLPPRDPQSASALAAAGESVLRHLSYGRWSKEKVQTVAACARTIRLVGSEKAQRMLREDYVVDDRKGVLSEVFQNINPLEIPYIHQKLFNGDRYSNRYISPFINDLTPLRKLTGIQNIALYSCEMITDLSPLSALNGLVTLRLDGLHKVTDLKPLSTLISLQTLRLSRYQGTDLSPLSALSGLVHLELDTLSNVTDLSSLSALSDLVHLELDTLPNVTDLCPLSKLGKLKTLRMRFNRTKDLSPLSALESLTHLDLDYISDNADLRPLSFLKGLQTMNVWRCNVNDLSPLSSLSDLARLELHELPNVTDLTPLSALKGLEELTLWKMNKVTDLTPLSRLTELQALWIWECDNLLSDLTPLISLKKLKKLFLPEKFNHKLPKELRHLVR